MRNIVRLAVRTLNDVSSPRFLVRTLSSNAIVGGRVGDKESGNSFEPSSDFEQRIFSSKTNSFFKSLDSIGKGRDSFGSNMNAESNYGIMDGLDESFDTLQDGMDGKLQKAATYFEFDAEEILQDEYAFRPDVNFRRGMTYDVKDLDLTKPGVRKPPQRAEFKVTTAEVLKKADFRNVRFLANFLTEAGIIIKRSQTGISAKAQRKVAREIKTARAFGLMPFTTMGTKQFVFGKTMEGLDEDYEYENFDGNVIADAE
ncbi:uncharacterized protein LOC133796816 [Humulus lupulus]|uniref:uncharacterized protein LOC133796816 n=1 Tax=Humulus lupulus TaxID=3486 RepID=UPI002B40C6E3|nr:uncharacterized protein LOC133796816 [Humulus lupulus]